MVPTDRESPAFSSRVMVEMLVFPKKLFAMEMIDEVLPLPGGPCRIMFGVASMDVNDCNALIT